MDLPPNMGGFLFINQKISQSWYNMRTNMADEKKYIELEARWQKWWEGHPELYRADDERVLGAEDGLGVDGGDLKGGGKKPKKYVLVEFPYPSGSGLHIGHAFTFTGGDVYARFKRMQGFEVLFPMGWDAFGLPTENYAIKTKRKPQEVTKENTNNYRLEMKKLAFSFDWSREVNTTDPGYYKWTQWIFIKLFEKGLAYKQEMPINWCPKCKIGLANEEVVAGNCERCGTEVERRKVSQWVVKITEYADRLLEGLQKTNFVERVKQAQINWIDRKEWIDITYEIKGTGEKVVVATTRPDTNFGATFVVLAPEHRLVDKLLNGSLETREDLAKIGDYVKRARNKSELDRQKEVTGREKTGVFTGLYATNQLTGKEMPIWITDFVLNSVGTGAVVGVPGHDVRDFEFAQQFGLEVIRVVVGKNGEKGKILDKSQVSEDEGVMINSGFLDGMDVREATAKIMDYIEEKGWGKRSIRYHLRDWIFSRQHYWGEPIPMIFCENCAKNQKDQILNSKTIKEKDKTILLNNVGWVSVPESELPVVLPAVEAYEPTDDGQSPLAKIEDFVKCRCPVCGMEARRETDTMPNWAGSDWYFIRYLDPTNKDKIADAGSIERWLPVDVYVGGDEHNTLHLLYSRFIFKFLNDLGVVGQDEPYDRRVSHGVILGPDGQRMSKSRGNVVVPGEVTEKYGVDVLRMYLMFMGPYESTMAWNEKTLMGVKRFLERFEKFVSGQLKNGLARNDWELVAIEKSVLGVTADLEVFSYNTAVAKLMEMLNGVTAETEGGKNLGRVSLKKMIKLLAPFAPYLAEEMWFEVWKDEFGRAGMDEDYVSVHTSNWPEAGRIVLAAAEVTIPVCVGGKKRGEIKISKEIVSDKSRVLEAARKDEKVAKWLEGKVVKMEIYVEGKMVNLVV